jgi:hypothetical protein
MGSDQLIAIFSACIGFFGLLLVVIQIRHSVRQRSLESLYQVYDINRELLSLGFSHPDLFKVLLDEGNVDPQWERRYLQLWLNQLSLIHTFLRHGGFDEEFQECLKREISDFMGLRNMRCHWETRGPFYPASFQKLVDGIIRGLPTCSSTVSGS